MATAPKIYGRERWDARHPRGDMATQDPGRHARLFFHHSDFFGKTIDTLKEQSAAMRSMQDYHMDHNGWSDIGYSFVIFQPRGGLQDARLFMGRGIHKVPAAQAGHNTGNLAVCLAGDFTREHVMKDTLDLMVRVALWLPGDSVSGHQAVNSTDCPGTNVMKVLPEVAKKSRRNFVR